MLQYQKACDTRVQQEVQLEASQMTFVGLNMCVGLIFYNFDVHVSQFGYRKHSSWIR
jgi:hypothetical protein